MRTVCALIFTAVGAASLASCGVAKPEFDDGRYAAWIASSRPDATGDAADTAVNWSARPTFDELKVAYPATAHGLISVGLRCQLHRDRSFTGCAFVEGNPDTAEVRQVGVRIAAKFQIEPSAVKEASTSKPFAEVFVAICKRANPGVGEDECVQPEKAEAETVPAEDKSTT